ncbi:RidA family protein [Halorubrum sp. DTA98]|uniref:RidA family protein n=1 Tax=Halorubrum sp. DTA98 TaxID=3402163 RepID=UPI003AB05C19
MSEPLSTDDVHDDPAPYSQGIMTGRTIRLAGQVPDDRDGRIVGTGIESQTRQAVANVEALLAVADATLRDVVSVTAYLVDRGDVDGFNATYAAAFPEPRPARATVIVEDLVVDALVEIQATAVRPAGESPGSAPSALDGSSD